MDSYVHCAGWAGAHAPPRPKASCSQPATRQLRASYAPAARQLRASCPPSRSIPPSRVHPSVPGPAANLSIQPPRSSYPVQASLFIHPSTRPHKLASSLSIIESHRTHHPEEVKQRRPLSYIANNKTGVDPTVASAEDNALDRLRHLALKVGRRDLERWDAWRVGAQRVWWRCMFLLGVLCEV